MRTVQESWKLWSEIKLIALKMETCSSHEEDSIYIRNYKCEKRKYNFPIDKSFLTELKKKIHIRAN